MTTRGKNVKIFYRSSDLGSDFLILEAFACSDVGVQRSENEDNLYFNGLIKEETAESFEHYEKINIKKGCAVFGVFDGMGGYAKGEHAAYLTADTVKTILENDKKSESEKLLRKICVDANTKICDEIKNDSGQKMGATLALLLFERSRYRLCNVGDSSVYMMRKGELKKISLEHTEAAAYVKIYGEAPPKDKKFPLTQHIGMSEDPERLNPYYQTDNIMEGDIFLICSDGLTDMLDDAEISRVINSSRPISGIGKILLNNALDRGGNDNISFVLIKATDVPEPIVELPKRETPKPEPTPQPPKEPEIKEETQKSETKVKTSKTEGKHIEKKVLNEEEISERKAMRKIIIGTIIFAAAIAVVSFVYINQLSPDIINGWFNG